MLSAHGSAPGGRRRRARRRALRRQRGVPARHQSAPRSAGAGPQGLHDPLRRSRRPRRSGRHARRRARRDPARRARRRSGTGDQRGRRPEPSLAMLAQTTLAHGEWSGILDQTRAQVGDVWTASRNDLCFATTNRQAALTAIAQRADAVVVIGSANSSNTLALVQVARDAGCRVVLRVDGPDELDLTQLDGARVVGVTAGASAPEELVDAVDRGSSHPTPGVERVRVTDEDEYFPPPPELRELVPALDTIAAFAFGGDPAAARALGGTIRGRPVVRRRGDARQPRRLTRLAIREARTPGRRRAAASSARRAVSASTRSRGTSVPANGCGSDRRTDHDRDPAEARNRHPDSNAGSPRSRPSRPGSSARRRATRGTRLRAGALGSSDRAGACPRGNTPKTSPRAQHAPPSPARLCDRSRRASTGKSAQPGEDRPDDRNREHRLLAHEPDPAMASTIAAERNVHHRPVRRGEDEPAALRQVLLPDHPHAPRHAAEPHDEAGGRSGRRASGDARGPRASSRTSPTTSSTDATSGVELRSASSAGRSGDAARPLSSASRRASELFTSSTRNRALPTRPRRAGAGAPVPRRSRSGTSSPAPRGTPPSRYHALRPRRHRARPTHARWRATRTSRTDGCADTVDTAPVTSGPRISSLTSRPSIVVMPSSTAIVCCAAMRAQAASSSRANPASSDRAR